MAAWWTRRRAQRAVVRAARGTLPPTIAETATMPAVTVHGPAGEWVLHGIAHGQRRVLRMSPAVRAFLTDAIDSWRAAGERVLLEPALPALLGVDDDLALQADNPFGRLRPGELARVVAGWYRC